MKRLLVLISIAAMAFGLAAFQCSSTEITSAKLYIQQENIPKAKDALFKEISKNPKSDEGYYLLGNVYRQQGKFDSMLIFYEKSLEISNKFKQDIENWELKAWSNTFNKGVNFFNAAYKTANKDSTQMYYNKAENLFKISTRIQPDSAQGYDVLQRTYRNMGEYQKAIKPLQKLVKMRADTSDYIALIDIYKFIAKENQREHDSTEAKKYYDNAYSLTLTAIEKYEENSPFLNRYIGLAVAANKTNEAKDDLETSIKNQPNNKVTRYLYGRIMFNTKKYNESIDNFTKAIEIDSSFTDAYYGAGASLYNKALEIKKNVNKLDENDEDYEKNLDKYDFETKFRESKEFAEKVVKLKPDYVRGWDLLGKIYANLGMNEKSKNAFAQADALRNKTQLMGKTRSEVINKMGEPEKEVERQHKNYGNTKLLFFEDGRIQVFLKNNEVVEITTIKEN